MNDERAVRSASASVGQLGAALRRAVAQMRADDATARRSADERTLELFVGRDALEQLMARVPSEQTRLWSSPATLPGAVPNDTITAYTPPKCVPGRCALPPVSGPALIKR